jgi:hypothetical protein
LALVKIAKYRFDLVHTFWFCHLDPIFENQGGILRMYPHFQGGQTFRKVINIQGVRRNRKNPLRLAKNGHFFVSDATTLTSYKKMITQAL